MSLKLNSSGGGSVLIQEPSTASNVTFTLPSETATAVYANASGNVGIGTSSPDAKVSLQSGGDAQMTFKDTGGTTRAYVGTSGAFGSAPTGALRIRSDQGGIVFGISGTETARLDTSSNFQFNSGYGSVATAYGCRAWVNFNGTGTVAIRASGNVSSITDNGTGDYTVNFTTAMPDANYSISATSDSTNTNAPQGIVINYSTAINNKVTPTTSAFRLACMVLSTGAGFDNPYINASVFR